MLRYLKMPKIPSADTQLGFDVYLLLCGGAGHGLKGESFIELSSDDEIVIDEPRPGKKNFIVDPSFRKKTALEMHR